MDMALLPEVELGPEVDSCRMTGSYSEPYRPNITARSKARNLVRACRIVCDVEVRASEVNRLQVEKVTHERQLKTFLRPSSIEPVDGGSCRVEAGSQEAPHRQHQRRRRCYPV